MAKTSKSFYFLILFFIITSTLSAQVGGSSTYEFLNLTNSARIAALGGNFMAVKDNDINLAIANPSLISSGMDNKLALSYVNDFANINYGYAAYSKTFKNPGSFVASIQYVNYGTFTNADATGQTYGTFRAAEYAFNLGWGRQLDSNFSIGANLKAINSVMETYSSFGLAVDVAGTYYNKKKQFAASLIFKNAGRQLSYYTPSNNETLPFEIQLGLSQKLSHAPFRIDIVLTHLEKWDLMYEDPLNPSVKTDPLTGETTTRSSLSKFADNAMRHIVAGIEFTPSNNFYVSFGYNYQRRQEMKVDTDLAMVGFSWGFGFRISKFNISFARVTQHVAGSTNFFTLATNLSAF